MFLASLVLNFTKQRKLTKKKKKKKNTLLYTKFILMKYEIIYYIIIFSRLYCSSQRINLRINF